MKRFVHADPNLCIGCDTCMAACITTHMAEGMDAQPRLQISRKGKVTVPVTCRHCENAPCAAVCPTDAIRVNAGSVTVTEALCNGCEACILACPFGVMGLSSDGATHYERTMGWHNAAGKEQAQPGRGCKTVAVKCDLCDFSQAGPECVRVCPTNALFVVDTKALKKTGNAKRKAAAQGLSVMRGVMNKLRP